MSAAVEQVKQAVKANEPAKLSGLQLYSRFAFAGAVCCSVTHGAFTPVDVYVPSGRHRPGHAALSASTDELLHF